MVLTDLTVLTVVFFKFFIAVLESTPLKWLGITIMFVAKSFFHLLFERSIFCMTQVKRPHPFAPLPSLPQDRQGKPDPPL
jgi:hypothetical protein